MSVSTEGMYPLKGGDAVCDTDITIGRLSITTLICNLHNGGEFDSEGCRICGAQENLEVHHRSYKRLAARNEIFDIITLCHDCHAMIHGIKPKEEFDVISDTEADSLLERM